MKNATVTTTRQLRDTMAESYRRTAGQTVTVTLPGATVRVPAFVDGINAGKTVLDAVAYHVTEWGQSERGAMSELATRWVDMVSHPNAPAVELVAIDWLLDLHTLVTGEWLD